MFALLFAQQAGAVHPVLHLAQHHQDRAPDHTQLPAEQDCKQCLAFAQIGAALTGNVFLLPADEAPQAVLPLRTAALPVLRTIRAYQSHAPPAVA